jgi:uncharacterized protein (DUF488 family)
LSSTLYTLGYTGIEPQEILDAAKRVDAIIADIRISPRSRHPQWNGHALRGAWGSHYLHLPVLGNKNYKGEYGIGVMLKNPELGADTVLALLVNRPVILLCACPNWETCHRRNAAEFIQQRRPTLSVIHLSTSDLRALGLPTQQSLF